MGYCKPGNKPTIYYEFGDGSSGKKQLPIAPITVEVKEEPPPFKGGQCENQKYWVTYRYDYYGYNVGGELAYEFWGKIGGIRTIDTGTAKETGTKYGTSRVEILCRDSSRYRPPGEYKWYFLLSAEKGRGSIVSIVPYGDFIDNCGDPPGKCKLEVKYNNKLVFAKMGECPCSYSVQCEKCPPGTVECGDCCLPCNQVKYQLRAIKNMVIGKRK